VDQKESGSSAYTLSPYDPESNRGGSENGISGKTSPRPPSVDPNHDASNWALYGIFMIEKSNQLEFRSTLVYECTKKEEKVAQACEMIEWEDFQFQKLNRGEIGYSDDEWDRLLHDVCDPLDGEKTISYVLDNVSGIYLLRFGVCTTQLWRLVEIPTDKLEEAKKGMKVFDFGKLPLFSTAAYYNTLTDNNLIFARVYKGNHHTHLSTFRDTLGCQGPVFRFMKNPGHIIVNITREIDGDRNVQLRNEPSFTRRRVPRIGARFHSVEDNKKPDPPVIDDELFLPLSKISHPDAEAEFCEIESAFQTLHYLDTIKKIPYKSVSLILSFPYNCIHKFIFVFIFFKKKKLGRIVIVKMILTKTEIISSSKLKII
jgi:hypothetical protein